MHALTGWLKIHSVGFALGLLLLGCQAVFGDFEFHPMQSGVGGQVGSAAVGGATSLSSECTSEGTYRCNGAALEMCQTAKWQAQLTCPTAVQCDKDHARCRTCEPKSLRCSAFRLERCQDSGEGWSLVESCVTADRCDAVNGTCATCGVDEAFCSGPRLNVCNAARSGWGVTVCDNANLCSTVSRSCRICVTGEYQCNQNVLQRCNEAQEWVTADECASNVLCTASLTTKATLEGKSPAWGGKCDAPLCASGAYRCNPDSPAQVQTCPPSRDRWEDVGTACYTAALCDATLGKCKDGCQPGTYSCNGAQLLHCVADGTKLEQVQVCPTAAQCSAAKQTCMPCVAGELQCNGTQLQQCSAGQVWENRGACATAALCALSVKNKSNVCTAAGCSPAGAQQCGGTNKVTLQTCPASLVSWVDKGEVCETPGLCDKGLAACIPPVCDFAGQTRCSGQNHETCDTNRKNWVPDATCTTGQICDVAKGCLGQCPTVAQRCNGKQIEICSVNATTQTPAWSPGTACVTAALCSVNATTGKASCSLPTCNDGQYACNGKVLNVCNAGRTGWDTVATCTATQICDAGGKQCDNCVAGNYACSGTNLQLCSSDGQTWGDFRTDCLSCATTTDAKTGYCYICNSGDQQCNSASIRTCATTRTAWNAETACTAGYGCQVVDGFKDFCAACPTANEVQCSTATATHVCAANRSSWTSEASCAYGCVADPTGNDYCASSCAPNAIECVGTTGLHTCSSTGSGWSATLSECANPTSLKACAGGEFTGTVACPATTPNCLDGKCVACVGTGIECADSSTSRTCSANNWVTQSCTGDTPICATSSGSCVACTVASVATCPTTTTRHFCSNNAWADETCPAATPVCSNGACVACTSSDSPTCSDSTTRRYCSGTTWATEVCSGDTLACYNGACSACNDSTAATCPTATTRSYCVGGSFATETCSGACAGGACVGCIATSTPKCDSSSAVQVCQNNAWVAQECPATAPVCVSGACVECVNSDWICDSSANNLRRRCSSNAWETVTCGSPTPYCSAGACVACLSDNTGCGTNQLCESGVCVDQPVPDAGVDDAGGAIGAGGTVGVGG